MSRATRELLFCPPLLQKKFRCFEIFRRKWPNEPQLGLLQSKRLISGQKQLNWVRLDRLYGFKYASKVAFWFWPFSAILAILRSFYSYFWLHIQLFVSVNVKLHKGGFKPCILTQLEVSSRNFDDIYDPPLLL